MVSSVVECLKLIVKVRFQGIEAKLDLANALNLVSLRNEHPLNLIHTLTTLASRVSNQTISNTELVNSLVSTLHPSPKTIIKAQHDTCIKWHPRINSNSDSHESYVSGGTVLLINPFKDTHYSTHAFCQL